MSANDFAIKLEDAADRIGDIPRAELAVLLRRAALRLRNTGPAEQQKAPPVVRLAGRGVKPEPPAR